MPAKVKMKSRKQVNYIVSHVAGVKAHLRTKAQGIGAKAEALLESHHTPERQSQISITYGEIDSFINLDDPAAMSIEFGHTHNGNGSWVPGLYIITGAAGLR